MPIVALPTPVNFTLGDHVVGIWITSNEIGLTLTNAVGIMNGRCVTGPSGSPFGLFAYCNADMFWNTVNSLVQQGKITLPPLGVAVDGLPCPTLLDYLIAGPGIDVPTRYLVTNLGAVVQKTTNNMKMFNIQAELGNNGNNRLLFMINAAIGCNNLLIRDASDPGMNSTALPLNILQGMLFTQPKALIPINDPNVQTNGQSDLVKLNIYRLALDEPQSAVIGGDNDPTTFCRNFGQVAVSRLKSLATQLKNTVGPTPGQTLFSYMVYRGSAIYALYNCAQLTGVPDPFIGLN
jgi:hypothetical protein